MNMLIVVVLWIAYCALHSFLISTGVTRLMERTLKEYYAFYRMAYVILSLVLLVPLIRFTTQCEGEPTIVYSMPASLLRVALMWGSLAVCVWAFFVDYDALSFFGVRQILHFGEPPGTKQPGAIRRRGLLGIVRHPMYLTLIIFLWCGIFTVMNVVVNTILTIYVFIGTVLEEKKLVLEFGDEYVRYQHDVPMLIPFTKPKAVKLVS